MRVPKPIRALVCALAVGAVAAPIALAGNDRGIVQDDTVTISGRAYEFNSMSTYLEGAVIKVRELPGLSATTDANGVYSLEVPNDANVTPYIDPPDGYNEIDLQTFHTRGEDIENANFQTPNDFAYNGLSALLAVPRRPDGRPQDCVIVTTASARNVRGVPYETFHARTPHGVEGAQSGSVPELPPPTYFNESVIPDKSQPHSSEDGGIIWTEVPAGTYRIYTLHSETRFASFLATCASGRVVNANPPWGAYELAPGEQPLGAGIVATTVRDVAGKGKGEGRRVVATFDSAEAIKVRAGVRKGGKRFGGVVTEVGPGVDQVTVPVREDARRGPATLRVTLRDGAADKVVERHRLTLPPRK
jgi:hypothetical protein